MICTPQQISFGW